MRTKRTKAVVSFIVAFSFIFGTTLMSLMATSEAMASTRSEQTVAGISSGQCFLSTICPAHSSGACFQCAQAMQYNSSAVTLSDQDLSSVNNPSAQVPFLSWINIIDPGPPRIISSI
jgi:hypothetical protein